MKRFSSFFALAFVCVLSPALAAAAYTGHWEAFIYFGVVGGVTWKILRVWENGETKEN